MAPEVIELEPATTASDIWSLGCTIIELLTGVPPYFDNTAMSALYKMVNEEHPPLPERISPELEDFLLKCFRRDPSERPTAEELLNHPWIESHSQKIKCKKIEVAQLKGTLRRYTHMRDKHESATSIYSLFNESSENLTTPASPTTTTSSVSGASILEATSDSSLESNSPPSSPSKSETDISSEPLVVNRKVTSVAPSTISAGTSSPKTRPLMKAKSEISDSVLKSINIIKPEPAQTQSVKGVDLRVPLRLELTGKESEGSQRSGRGMSVDDDALSPRSKLKKKGKKFNFKDLKNQFEALAFNPDYLVLITGTETRKNLVFSYTVFKMKVKLKSDNWVVYRTFNDFKELHAKLEKRMPTIKLPPLPPDKFFGFLEPQFVKRRKEDLQIFLDQLLKIPTVCKSDVFQYFLEA
eukprot:TRINITY_DN8375_c0_g1_i1.p2 TRINITY_DN8375_c0_g1~~TRINITY_DN8375_c0_g1_i1.p2  ORF type:complete len:411 (-),score=80.32 TRINITY_DN8375_c0_g1_i1:307-1539(-)